MTRKKILFIADTAPSPVDRGQRVRIRGLLNACRTVADVVLVTPSPAREAERLRAETEFSRCLWIDRQPPPRLASRLRLVASTASRVIGLPTPGKIAAHWPYLQAIERADPESFDLIWAERPHIAALCRPWANKTVVDLDDLEHLKLAGERKLARRALTRAKLAYRERFYRRIETGWARMFKAAAVCADDDRAALRRAGADNTLVVPNAASLPVAKSQPAPTHGAPRLVFLGNLEYGPNADALAWLAGDVMPLMRRAEPDAVLDVIGPKAPDGAALSESIVYRGFVGDLASALQDYDVMVAPLRYGGGTKLKVLDALARGVPVVTTRVGAAGLGLTHGRNVWLAETAEEIVAGVLRIKRDVALTARLSMNGRAHVASRFTWPFVEARLAAWLRRTMFAGAPEADAPRARRSGPLARDVVAGAGGGRRLSA